MIINIKGVWGKPISDLPPGTFFLKQNYIQDGYKIYQIPSASSALTKTAYTLHVYVLHRFSDTISEISTEVFRVDDLVIPIQLKKVTADIEIAA